MARRGAAVEMHSLMSEDQLEALADGEELGTWAKASDVRGALSVSAIATTRQPSIYPLPLNALPRCLLRIRAGCARSAQNSEGEAACSRRGRGERRIRVHDDYQHECLQLPRDRGAAPR